MTKAKKYILSVGNQGATRLELLDEIYGPYTQQFLKNIGFRPDMRVLDVGCGLGFVTCWLARQVGRYGKVIGVDCSEEQIQIAKENATKQKLHNIEFIVSSIYDLDQLGMDFDLVFCRFILVHLDQPERALNMMYKVVKSQGILVCDEPCLAAATAYPPSDAFDMSKSLTYQLTRQKGLDWDFGRKVYSIFKNLEFASVVLQVIQPSLTTAHQKMLWPMFFEETRTEFLASGLTNEAEFDNYMLPGLMEIVENDGSFILPMRNFQVCGRK